MWSNQELEYIKNNAEIMKDAEIAANLCRITGRHISAIAVRKHRKKLGITKIHGRGKCVIDRRLKNDVTLFLSTAGQQ